MIRFVNNICVYTAQKWFINFFFLWNTVLEYFSWNWEETTPQRIGCIISCYGSPLSACTEDWVSRFSVNNLCFIYFHAYLSMPEFGFSQNSPSYGCIWDSVYLKGQSDSFSLAPYISLLCLSSCLILLECIFSEQHWKHPFQSCCIL